MLHTPQIHISQLKRINAALSRPSLVQDSPISNLPPELILKIVELGGDDAHCTVRIVASLVCSHWRAVLLGSPILWTTIYIHNFVSDDPTHQLERAFTFATRSSACSMGFFIDLAPPCVSPNETRRLVLSIAAFIAQHKERISHLSIRYTPEFQTMGVSAMVPPALARLLDMCSVQCVPSDFFEEYSVFDGPSNQTILPLFQLPDGESGDADQPEEHFPDLQDLTLTAIALVWGRFAPRSLQCLTLHDLKSATAPTWAEICNILEVNASTLIDLDLDEVYPVGPQIHQPFEMPALWKLRIAYTDSAFLVFFSTMCRVPHLEQLRIHDKGGDRADAHDALRQYALLCVIAHMPLYNIRHLHLSGITFLPASGVTVMFGNDSLPVAFMRRLSSLERLKLTNPDRCTLVTLNCFHPHLTSEGEDVTDRPPAQVAPFLSRLSLRQIPLALFNDFIGDRAVMASWGPTPIRMLDVLDIRPRWGEPEVNPARYAVVKSKVVDRLKFLEPIF
ncbi:hypothetical protein BD779DRAFT_1557527 [Infundibulicybe gibba]|nr:hypothetical protein BD779DRAFT_1557527 [Infundibulicybe gibba]